MGEAFCFLLEVIGGGVAGYFVGRHGRHHRWPPAFVILLAFMVPWVVLWSLIVNLVVN